MTMKRTTTIRFFAILLLAALSVSMTACTPHVERERLQRTEEVIETDAAAAAATLDSIRPSSLHGDARARYALLRTQSDYKNSVLLTSDSLITIATRHYGTRRRTLPAALAQYYLGCCYKDMGRDLDAIDALLRATTLFPDTTNKYYAYSHSELGLLYITHNMPDKAIPLLEKYGEYGRNIGDSTIIGLANYHLGRAYLRMNEEEKVKEAFYRVMDSSAVSRSVKEKCLFYLAKLAFYKENDKERSERYINQYLQAFAGSHQIGAAYTLKGDIEHAASRMDSAYYYYQRALIGNNDYATKCMAYKGLSEIAPYLLQQDSVAGYIQKYTAYLDSVYVQSHREEINELNANHVIELHDREMAERHSRLLWFLGLGGLVLIAAAVISVLAVKRRQQAEKLAYQEELAALRREQISQRVQEDELVESADTDITDADCEAASEADAALLPRFEFFRRNVEAYRVQFEKSEWAELLKDNQADILLKKKLNADKGEAMMAYITDLFSDLFIHLLNDNASLSRLDLEYCAMVMLHMKTDQMAYCTQATVHSYHCRHGKVRDKLTDDWYVLIFGKPKK